MDQNRVLDLIIFWIKGIKNNFILSDKFEDENLSIGNCGYLLGQTLRQYAVPEDHYFVSDEAYKLWLKIRTDSIFNYTYRDKIVKNNDDVVFIDKYKGSERKPYQENVQLSIGDSFIFNDVFTDEHVVPINIIIKELISLQIYDYPSVKNILDKIYICKMLKGEDYRIAKRSKRSINYEEVINNDYIDAGIIIRNFKYCKEFIERSNNQNNETENNFIRGKNVSVQQKNNTKRKLQYNEYFVIKNERKSYRNKTGFKAYNNSNEEIGIVFMCDDERTPAFQHCELCVYQEYVNKYGEWHRIKSHGARIKWQSLCEILNKQKSYKLFID